ncbi:MAG TPA: DUF2752 domain-containing protein [Stackebrandtia sp.]|jgi:hypothetical protein|uniref:DUF2752 domain-containing protein n=1 Tax=Stackebrandtia sp. TaxID=2023065 RepID=UPI002D41A3D3|nr:DUF2752 domain-containing protein [Stackebrandtia sp.]HZE39996.1 DUF2752 domain-containing protein [Stackebrandtia sp.]
MTGAVPLPAPSRRHPAAAPAAVAALGVAGLAYLWGHNPHDASQVMVPCVFHLATGLDCPACGGTRMAFDLLHGNLSAAWRDNAVLLLAAPALLAAYGRWTWEGFRGRRWRLRVPRIGVAAVLAVAVAWTVARNLVL